MFTVLPPIEYSKNVGARPCWHIVIYLSFLETLVKAILLDRRLIGIVT